MASLDELEEAVVSHMHYEGGGNPLGGMGLVAPTELIVTGLDKKMDCYCRGGRWVGSPEIGFCIPSSTDTNKRFDKIAKACVVIDPSKPSQMPPKDIPITGISWFEKNRHWVILGGAAAISLGILIWRR